MHSTGSTTDELMGRIHGLRDREESERIRQLGGLLVHDLNNVLFALLGRLQLLERKAADPATAKSAREIVETARQLERLIVRMHAACRREEPEVARIPVRAAVESAFAESLPGLPDAVRPTGIDTVLAAIPSDARIEAADEQVATAVRQLLAIHRSRSRGRIAASVTVARDDSAVGSGEVIAIGFEDDGGRPEQLPEIPTLAAEKFDLASLPLAAANRATRDFGGSVRCEATARGMRTEFRFPFERGVAIARFDAKGTQTTIDESCDHGRMEEPEPRRVLIADDDPAVRAVLVAALEAVGDDVDTLADPGACDAHPSLGEFDVVILDAGGGGLEALARLRARGVDVPVLVASGDIVERAGDPLTRCVLKPIRLERLDTDLASLARLRSK